MYRSTPNATTGVSPAEFLYRRKLRTKLPELQEFALDGLEVKEKAWENKGKGKMYGDAKRNACENDIKACDSVLVQQEKKNKFSTVFHPKPFMVIQNNVNMVQIESKTGNQSKRNVTEIRPFRKRPGIKYLFRK